MSGLLPKFINIRRGGYAVIIIGIGKLLHVTNSSFSPRQALITKCAAMQPWQLSNTDSKFLSVMGSYAIFLAPLSMWPLYRRFSHAFAHNVSQLEYFIASIILSVNRGSPW